MVISWRSGSVPIKLCVFQGDPEGCGLSALRWHGRVVPAAHGRHLEPLQVLQQHSAGGNGPGTRGPKDRVVQSLCTPPFLWSHRGQLWRDADESHEDPGRRIQSKVENVSAERSFEVWIEPLGPEVSLPDAGFTLWVGCDWGSLIATFASQTHALRRTQFSSPSGSWAAGWLRLGAEMQMLPCFDVFSFFMKAGAALQPSATKQCCYFRTVWSLLACPGRTCYIHFTRSTRTTSPGETRTSSTSYSTTTQVLRLLDLIHMFMLCSSLNGW